MKPSQNPLSLTLLALLFGSFMASSVQANPSPQVKQSQVAGSSNLNTLTLSGDTLFASDSATLTSKGRQALDAMLKKDQTLLQMPMTITGHTDNMGDPVHNRDLSFRRAEAIRQYFKEKGHFARADVHGLGETKPLVSCQGIKAKDKLIKCLAPNRRVEIEQLYGQ